MTTEDEWHSALIRMIFDEDNPPSYPEPARRQHGVFTVSPDHQSAELVRFIEDENGLPTSTLATPMVPGVGGWVRAEPDVGP